MQQAPNPVHARLGVAGSGGQSPVLQELPGQQNLRSSDIVSQTDVSAPSGVLRDIGWIATEPLVGIIMTTLCGL
jgi:hypothetical protein